jgi:hypothetical protein
MGSAAAAETGSRHQMTSAEGEIPGEAADTVLDDAGGSAVEAIPVEEAGASSGTTAGNIVGVAAGAGSVH